MKTITLILLLLSTALFALNREDVIGKWTFYTLSENEQCPEYYQFNGDGTCFFFFAKEYGEGTWKIEEDFLSIAMIMHSAGESGRGVDTTEWNDSWYVNSIDAKTLSYSIIHANGRPSTNETLVKVDPQNELTLPSGWITAAKGIVKGDLTGDGIDDIARVIDNPKSDQRILQVYMGNRKGAYTLHIKNSKVIMGYDEGGMQGDPFQGLRYKRNSLFITFYGGSRDRWSYTYQFLKRQGALSLIGEERESLDTFTSDHVLTSINYLSGKTLTRRGKEGGPYSEKWTKQGKKPLIKLKDFKVY